MRLTRFAPAPPQAVKEDYYFQMFYDDLPIWGFVGKIDKVVQPQGTTENRYYLFTHGALTGCAQSPTLLGYALNPARVQAQSPAVPRQHESVGDVEGGD